MNVYYAGGEDIDCTPFGGITWQNTAPYIYTPYSRYGTEIAATSSSWPMANGCNISSFGNQSSFWFHAQCYVGGNSTVASGIFLAMADSSGVGRILVRGTGSNGQLKISTRNAANTYVDLVTSALNILPVASAIVSVDLFVNYSTSGQVTLYIGGVNVLDTGPGVNVTTDSATTLSVGYMGGLSPAAYVWSEIIVADSDTRTARLWTMNSSTAGNAQTWVGTGSNVNQLRVVDTSFITAATPGLINEYKTPSIPLPAGTWTVAAVVMTSRGFGGTVGGPTKLEYVTRVGSTDYVGGTWTPPSGLFGNAPSPYVSSLNPATGVAWTTADLTAATFNYGIESVA